MVLSFLVAFGAVTGASEGIKASQAKARREEHRSRKNNLIVHVPKSSEYSKVLENRHVVLSGDKVCCLIFLLDLRVSRPAQRPRRNLPLYPK